MPVADLLLLNGTVITMDTNQPTAEAVAVKQGKIFAVGTTDGMRGYIGPKTQVIELNGDMVIPGLIEGHGHFLWLGYQQMNVDLLDTKSYREVVDSVAERIAETPAGQWIEGRGWHQEKWTDQPEETVKGFPTHNALSAISPNHPVVLDHASGHAILANAKAMAIAGITDDTPNPEGGTIIRDSLGQATGVFEENAERLIKDKLEEWKNNKPKSERKADFRKAVQLAGEQCWQHGITSFHDAASDFDMLTQLKELEATDSLPIRLYCFLFEPWSKLEPVLADWKKIDPEGFLTIRAIKQFYDGALGSRGALLTEPYSDDPGNFGHLTLDTSDFKAISEAAAELGFQLNTHAIGDSANHEVIDVYATSYRMHPDREHRWRIEHAQHLLPTDIPRFAEIGIIASMQSIHCISDAVYVPVRLGDQRAANGAYLWRSLLDSGAVVMEGTDVPVERINPFTNMYAAITRSSKADGIPFYPQQCKTIEEELQAYTMWNAYGAFEEEYKGSITPGKLADITVLDRNILTITPEELLDTEVVYTIIGGKIMYQR